MKTLTGRVEIHTLPHSKGTKESYKINPEAKIQIQIRDVSLMDAPSKLIASTELTGVTTFPFDFSLTYDETPLVGKPPNFFGLSIRIETNGRLDFITDTRFNVIGNDGNLLQHMDLFVVPVEH